VDGGHRGEDGVEEEAGHRDEEQERVQLRVRVLQHVQLRDLEKSDPKSEGTKRRPVVTLILWRKTDNPTDFSGRRSLSDGKKFFQ